MHPRFIETIAPFGQMVLGSGLFSWLFTLRWSVSTSSKGRKPVLRESRYLLQKEIKNVCMSFWSKSYSAFICLGCSEGSGFSLTLQCGDPKVLRKLKAHHLSAYCGGEQMTRLVSGL